MEQASESEQVVFVRKFLVWHLVASAKLQVWNLHSWSTRPKAQALAMVWQTPAPSHCPSQGLLAALGRQAAPAGAFCARQVRPLQYFLQALLPTPFVVPQLTPSSVPAATA
jgi:hypothetical protein